MKVSIPIRDVRVGMFLEAEVRTLLVEGEMRHFLEPLGAKYNQDTSKRIRLMKRRFEQVTNAGGMLVTSRKMLSGLEQIGVSEVVINTDKSDVIPDLPEEPPAPKRRSPPRPFDDLPPSSTETKWVQDLDPMEETEITSKETAPGEHDRHTRVQHVDVAGTDRRRNFGPSNTGWMKIEIVDTDDDGEPRLCAYLQVISFGGDGRMGAQDVFRGLEEQFGICAGIDEAMVQRLAEQASASPNRVIRGRFLIASSPRPDPTQVGTIEYTCLADVDGELPFARLRQAFAATERADVADSLVTVRAVAPGDSLAEFVPAGAGAGVVAPDIFGNTGAAAGAAELLKAGLNVSLVGDQYTADGFGYLCVDGGEISVIPPLWIDADHMEAHYVYLHDPTQAGLSLIRAELLQLLESMEVRSGLLDDAIDELLAAPPQGDEAKTILIAKGTRARRGEDARIDCAYMASSQAQPFDVAAHHQASLVKPGDLLAEVRAAAAGSPGLDLAGRRIEGDSGTEAFLIPGDNVRCEDVDDAQRMFAEVEGSARVVDRTIKVQPVVYIRGAVDAPFKAKPGADVYIRGSVRSGATVEADGTISVEGSVEGGAIVHSQQDVQVAKGIIGHGTRVVARGDVSSRFVQSGKIIAGGDVKSSQLMNASVRATNVDVLETGEQRSGTIVGGQTLATRRIEATRAGSPSRTETCVLLSGDPNLQAQINKLDKGLDFCRTNILRILRTLGVRQIDAVQLKALIDSAPPEKRKPLIKILTQLKQLVQTRDRSTEMRRGLEEEQQRLLTEAEIHISEIVHADVHIQIGERVLRPTDDIEGGAVFQLRGTKIEWSPPS